MLNNQPCGWGVLYDSEGEKKYEGFMIGEAYVCYGTRYYSDIQKVEYKGEWCEGMRWGRGVQYDRRGNTVFEGEWLNDEHEMEKKVVAERRPSNRPAQPRGGAVRSERVPLPGGLEKSRMLAHASSARACDWQGLRVCRGGGAGGGRLLGERCDRRQCIHRIEALRHQGLSRSEDAGRGQRLLLGMLLLRSPVPADAGVCAVWHDGE